MPKSGAKKAEWVNALECYFLKNTSFDLYKLLNGVRSDGRILGGNSLVAGLPASSAGPLSKSSPFKQSRTSPMKEIKLTSPYKVKHVFDPAAKKIDRMRASPHALKSSHAKRRKSNSAGAAAIAVKQPKLKSPLKSSSSAKRSMEEADAAMARTLQHQLMQEDIRQFIPHPPNPYMGYHGVPSWDGSSANFPAYNHHGNNTSAYSFTATAGAGISRPYISQSVPAHNNTNVAQKHSSIKVKKEPGTHTTIPSTSYVHPSSSSAASASCNNDDSSTPRDFRERAMVDSLRSMGFSDTREILSGLRAVAAQREDISIVSGPNDMGGLSTSEWSTQEQVEATMMWIVTQREEAAEAQKLDEARISSENAVVAMEQSRKDDEEQQMKNADIVDLVGSVEDSVEIQSKYFPCSVVLQNNVAKRVFTDIASCPSVSQANHGKEQVVRLLNLEKRARKWYGTVLPFSYFEYVLCPIFESCERYLPKAAKAHNTEFVTKINEILSTECEKLEKAMFNLSEQEEGSFGMVPKVFLAAQKDASANGKPICLVENSNNSDGVEIVQLHPSLVMNTKLGANKSPLNGNNGSQNNSPMDVIEIFLNPSHWTP